MPNVPAQTYTYSGCSNRRCVCNVCKGTPYGKNDMNTNEHLKGRAHRKFDAGLANLAATPVGNRHNKLLGLARLGLWAGFTPEDVEMLLIDAGKYQPNEYAETRTAIAKVLADFGTYTVFRSTAFKPSRRNAPRTPSVAEQGVFRECVRLGGGSATFADLRALSPSIVPVAQYAQAIAQIRALFDPTADTLWCGNLYDAKNPSTVASASEWCLRIQLTNRIPSFFAANPVTGMCANGSYRNAATIAAYRHAVIEIDTLPLETQAAFWMGVIKRNLLPLRTLTYSGGKSIHGIIRLTDDKAQWQSQWETLARCFASDPDPSYRIDLQCRDATRMSRLAGATRPDKNTHQELLWLQSADS